MRKFFIHAITLMLLSTACLAEKPATEKIKIITNQGNIVLELYPDKAPLTVANFLGYIDAGFYDGTIFHRVIKDFMIQGGGMDSDLKEKATRAPVKNESDNGLGNTRGTISMARTSDPHSASSQFFINVKDNDFLNFSSNGWGYAVFGKVTEGMDIADKISQQPTITKGPFSDVPQNTIIIKHVERSGAKAKKAANKSRKQPAAKTEQKN